MSTPHNNSDRDRVLAGSDILAIIGESIALRPKGREHLGLCPFHDDKSPSFAVVTHKSGSSVMGGCGFYKCFSCGAAGNAIDFVINFHRMDFPSALRFLAARANIELTPWQPNGSSSGPKRPDGEPTKDEVLRANLLAERFFQRVYADEAKGSKARAEVSRRGFETAIVEGFKIGAAGAKSDALVEGIKRGVALARESGGSDYPPFDAFVTAGVIRPARSGGGHIDLLRDRLVFPICDDLGRPIAFGGRKLDPEQEPKYLNSPETPVFSKSRSLYGIHLAKRRIIETKRAIVTEGYTDVIACHRAGFTNTVATLGTALTREHARMLRRLAETVVLLFDGDEAGQKAADRAVEVFFSESIDIKICVLPDNLDPDDLLRREGGAAQFASAVESSVDALRFMATRIRKQLEGRGMSGRQQVIEQTMAKFVDLGLNAMSGLRRQLVLQTLADICGVGSNDLDRLARTMRARPTASSADQSPQSDRSFDRAFEASSIPQSAFITEVPPLGGRQRARADAQRRLLGLLCCNPALASIAVPLEGAGTLPLCEAMNASEFVDHGYGSVFRAIQIAAEETRVLNFESLLGDLGSADLKRLASDLYTFGADTLRNSTTMVGANPSDRSLPEEILVSWHDLAKLERIERFSNSDSSANSAQNPGETLETSGETSSDPTISGQPQAIQPNINSPAANPSALNPQEAIARLARLRERGHDAAAVSQHHRNRSSPESDNARSNQL